MGQFFSTSSRFSSFWYDDRLLQACSKGWYHQVVTLVQHHGADVNCHDPYDGDTPLHKACRYAMLYDQYYDSNHHTNDIESSDLLNMVDYLLRRGAKVDAVDRGGCTVLMWACVYHDVELVRLLAQQYGANVHLRDPLEQTALHKAHDNLEIVRFLVTDCGADVRARDCFGHTLEDRLTNDIRRELPSREFTNRYEHRVRRAQEVLEYLHSLVPETTTDPTKTATSRNDVPDAMNGSSPFETTAAITTAATGPRLLLARQSARITDSFLAVSLREGQENLGSSNSICQHQIPSCDGNAEDATTVLPKEGDGLLRDFVHSERVHL